MCGADAAYEAMGEAALEALRAQGIARIWWAQKPGAREAALRAAGVQGFIHLGCDVAMTLSTLLEEVSP